MLLVIASACVYVRDERRWQVEQARQLRERLWVEHEQLLAEMRLERITQSALQRLLDEARRHA